MATTVIKLVKRICTLLVRATGQLTGTRRKLMFAAEDVSKLKLEPQMLLLLHFSACQKPRF